GLGTPEDQAELYRDLLRARRPAPPTGQGQATAAAYEPPVLATGQPLLEALLLSRRGPPLAAALQSVADDDPTLFNEAVAVLDRATDLRGLLWLWQNSARRDFKQFTGLLERAVQPRWYAELARAA